MEFLRQEGSHHLEVLMRAFFPDFLDHSNPVFMEIVMQGLDERRAEFVSRPTRATCWVA